jgi:hypothetical protein
MEKFMKFSLARAALTLAATATLAACGAGGKATFPVNVTVSNLVYPGMVMSTNGMDQKVDPLPKNADGTIPVVQFAFANQIDYGTVYDVVPKGLGSTALPFGQQPLHQTCSPVTYPKTGTAGQLAVIDVRYSCEINTLVLTGVIKGLTATGLKLANGSINTPVEPAPVLDANQKPTGADVPLTMASVPFGSTYGVVIVTQPTGQTCTLTGGANGSGAGTMDEVAEKAGGVTNLVVTCAANP